MLVCVDRVMMVVSQDSCDWRDDASVTARPRDDNCRGVLPHDIPLHRLAYTYAVVCTETILSQDLSVQSGR